MKHICPNCGNEFELGERTLPDCPQCVKDKMVHPNGLSPKHTPGTAPTNASYIADGVNAEAIFDYMAGGNHTEPSGCEIYYAPRYNSFNAVSYKPLGEIPGSGDFNGAPEAYQFAVWFDIEGQSSQGPHIAFEEESHLRQRVNNGEWVPAPKCASCGKVVVLQNGGACLNCQLGGATQP